MKNKKNMKVLLSIFLLASVMTGCKSEKVEEPTEESEKEAVIQDDEIRKPEYDNSQQYGSVILQDGDSITGGTYMAAGTDESVFEASDSVKAEITGSIINKESGDASSADASSFSGVNAAVRAYGNSTITLKDCIINADASNATGVFAYDGGSIGIYDSTVTVTGGGAGGIQVAGGGSLYASNLTVTSSSKAAIRSDRGGGTMVVDGGIYTSLGSNGCPVIYSTADILVKNATGVSEKSRAVIIEGKNSVTLENTILEGNDQSTKEGSVKANVLLYQSASGDAKDGTSVFTMTGGKLTSNSGAMFYCTNTESIINLCKAELVLSDTAELLRISAGRWGNDGRNGGNCTFNCTDQKLEGTIYVDDISSLNIDFKSTEFTGSINGDGEINITLDSSSKWILTEDSYVTSFSGNISAIITNGHKLYINGSLAAE